MERKVPEIKPFIYGVRIYDAPLNSDDDWDFDASDSEDYVPIPNLLYKKRKAQAYPEVDEKYRTWGSKRARHS